MKKIKLNSNEEKGTQNIIQRKERQSFIKSRGAQDSFTPPQTSTKQHSRLPTKLQSNLETSLGQDFSNVAIHTNSQKAVQMNAHAYTQGEHVHFAPGEFNPSSSKGQNLIGHEFTHVAQQRAGVVKPTKVLQKGVAVNDYKSLEHEADTFGKKAAKGETISKYKGAKAAESSTMQRKLKIDGVTAPERQAFVQKINDGSNMKFELDSANFLQLKNLVQIPIGEYDKRIEEAVISPQTVTLRLVNASNNAFIDNYNSGEVDVDDMFAMSADLFRSSFLHFIVERFHYHNYDTLRNVATQQEFDAAHKYAISSQEAFLREQYPLKTIKHISSALDQSSSLVDAAGNGTVDYVIDFTDVRYILTQPIVNTNLLENVVSSRIDIVR
ncbi:DUF4157 domain-containing protein [Kordia sp. YSTF-M3]|uniref:DUF4157 domain-containing protein n=1 Tax=Kordia aestuariivivens TaxID=2759037 RepID=A0ABR7QDB6_9FLAO|nr:DUF4157 domain-containing protein [Kordia aestuariivivens]MBC8756319.1 DUF4157 domain-containing protein [Kordia aestuariivivens]